MFFAFLSGRSLSLFDVILHLLERFSTSLRTFCVSLRLFCIPFWSFVSFWDRMASYWGCLVSFWNVTHFFEVIWLSLRSFHIIVLVLHIFQVALCLFEVVLHLFEILLWVRDHLACLWGCFVSLQSCFVFVNCNTFFWNFVSLWFCFTSFSGRIVNFLGSCDILKCHDSFWGHIWGRFCVFFCQVTLGIYPWPDSLIHVGTGAPGMANWISGGIHPSDPAPVYNSLAFHLIRHPYVRHSHPLFKPSSSLSASHPPVWCLWPTLSPPNHISLSLHPSRLRLLSLWTHRVENMDEHHTASNTTHHTPHHHHHHYQPSQSQWPDHLWLRIPVFN